MTGLGKNLVQWDRTDLGLSIDGQFPIFRFFINKNERMKYKHYDKR